MIARRLPAKPLRPSGSITSQKTWPCKYQTWAKGVFTSGLWTCLAVKVFDRPRMARDLMDVDCSHLSAMPPQLASARLRLPEGTQVVDALKPGSVRLCVLDSLVRRHKKSLRFQPNLMKHVRRIQIKETHGCFS